MISHPLTKIAVRIDQEWNGLVDLDEFFEIFAAVTGSRCALIGDFILEKGIERQFWERIGSYSGSISIRLLHPTIQELFPLDLQLEFLDELEQNTDVEYNAA